MQCYDLLEKAEAQLDEDVKVVVPLDVDPRFTPGKMSAADYCKRFWSELIVVPIGEEEYLVYSPRPNRLVLKSPELFRNVEGQMRIDSHWPSARYIIPREQPMYDTDLIGKLCIQVCSKPLHPGDPGQWTHPQEVNAFFREIGVPSCYWTIQNAAYAANSVEWGFWHKKRSTYQKHMLPSCVPTAEDVKDHCRLLKQGVDVVIVELRKLANRLETEQMASNH